MLEILGHTVVREAKVVGGTDYPDRTFYRDTITCETCGWVDEDFGDDLRLHVQHLTHALTGILTPNCENGGTTCKDCPGCHNEALG